MEKSTTKPKRFVKNAMERIEELFPQQKALRLFRAIPRLHTRCLMHLLRNQVFKCEEITLQTPYL